MQSSPIKFLTFPYGSGFFLKRRHYYAFIASKKNVKNTFFWMDDQSKTLNFEMVQNFIDVYQCHSPQKIGNKKFHP
jgi:hypothetical protein